MASFHVLAFNRALSQARDNVRNARKSVLHLSKARKEINAVTRVIAGFLGERDDIHMYAYGENPHISVTMRDLQSFKCDALVNLLYTLEEIGETVRTKDWAEYLNREYYFNVRNMTVCVNAYVKSTSPTCRKVQIGTETVIQPKYKIECD